MVLFIFGITPAIQPKEFSMKQVLMIGGFLFTLTVGAQSSFVIKPSELQLNCSSYTANLNIDALRFHTKSNLGQVSVNVDSEGICQALGSYFQAQGSLQVMVDSKISKYRQVFREGPCSGNTCVTEYRDSLIETVVVTINQIKFYGRAEVPKSVEYNKVEWDSRYCPPHDSNCDY
jgi:hypothetical protein